MFEPAKKHIITIAGRPGSGKSATAKAVASTLGFQHFSSGDLFRMIGDELGIDVLQANLTAEKDAEIDRRVDQRLGELGRTKDKLVIDSRLAWHWIPTSFKVFLDLNLEMAAERILKNIDEARMESEHIPRDPKIYAKMLKDRLESESRRYQAKYQIDAYDKRNFDLVIDTGVNDIAAVMNLVISRYHEWLSVRVER
jgi:cytidylate kinase